MVNKKELQFLSIFNMCISNNDSSSNKVNFFTDEGKLYLTQYSDSVNLVHIIEGDFTETFNVWYETSFIFNFIKSVADNTDILFSETEGIKIGATSWYKPKTYEYDNKSFDLVKSLINNTNIKKYTVKDLDKLNKAKNFIGNPYTKEYDCIRVDNGNFTTSYSDDKVSVIIKNNNVLEESLFIDKTIYTVVRSIGLNEMEIGLIVDKGYFIYNIDSFYIFYPEKKYELPNLAEEQFKPLYLHEDTIVVARKPLLDVLNRLGLITSKDYQNRIYFNVAKGSIEIECKDGAEAKENIPVLVSDNLIGHTFILSSTFVQQILTSLTEDKISIRVSKENTIAVSFTNLVNQDDIFIHCTYNDIPSA